MPAQLRDRVLLGSRVARGLLGSLMTCGTTTTIPASGHRLLLWTPRGAETAQNRFAPAWMGPSAGRGYHRVGMADAPAHTNRLAGETSPYLLQHAHNPVD